MRLVIEIFTQTIYTNLHYNFWLSHTHAQCIAKEVFSKYSKYSTYLSTLEQNAILNLHSSVRVV